MPITVTVVDVGGVIRATLSENGSGLLRADIAYAKAWSCIVTGWSKTTIRNILEEQPRLDKAAASMQILSDGKLLPTPGGLLIQNDYKNIGAVGISGDRSDEDEICAIAGIEAAGFVAGHRAI